MSEEYPEINQSVIDLCRNAGFEPLLKMAPDYAKLLESEVVKKAFEKFIKMLEVAI